MMMLQILHEHMVHSQKQMCSVPEFEKTKSGDLLFMHKIFSKWWRGVLQRKKPYVKNIEYAQNYSTPTYLAS
jgi:hypothetical protein